MTLARAGAATACLPACRPHCRSIEADSLGNRESRGLDKLERPLRHPVNHSPLSLQAPTAAPAPMRIWQRPRAEPEGRRRTKNSKPGTTQQITACVAATCLRRMSDTHGSGAVDFKIFAISPMALVTKRLCPRPWPNRTCSASEIATSRFYRALALISPTGWD